MPPRRPEARSKLATADLLVRLWPHITSRRQMQFCLLLVLMVLASFAEIFSIGTMLPFIGVLTSPETVYESPFIQPVRTYLGWSHPSDLLLPVTLMFCLAALVAGAMRVALVRVNTGLSHAVGTDLSLDAFRRTLYQPYAVHTARNSSVVVNGIFSKIGKLVTGLILPVLNLLTCCVLITAITITLLVIKPLVAIVALVTVGLIYGVVIRLTRNRVAHNSEQIAIQSTRVLKILNEGLGAIRDVLINSAQPDYCRTYRLADVPMRRAMAGNAFLAMVPRHGVEAFGLIVIALIAYQVALTGDGISSALPALAALAVGAQRLLPIIQQGYSSWTAIQGSRSSVDECLELLEQPLPDDISIAAPKRLPFTRSIKLENVGFRYSPGAPWVLRQVSLTISKGDRVGIVGTTGSGKSTLLDIVMGLLHPQEGLLTVDGAAIAQNNERSWQANIAHVPQAIFLSDCSIRQNVAFGVPENQIEFDRVVTAARQAQIHDTIETLPHGYETTVGERGIRLSGGQLQRIGIARALYRRVPVIVFDEATSALDGETEQAVMQAIESLDRDLTILIIAHRLSTLRNCNRIVELSAGRVIRNEAVVDPPQFQDSVPSDSSSVKVF